MHDIIPGCYLRLHGFDEVAAKTARAVFLAYPRAKNESRALFEHTSGIDVIYQVHHGIVGEEPVGYFNVANKLASIRILL